MTLNNLRLTFRRLGRQKLNTTLHIAGLTLGMSVCLLIGLFVRYELSFDKYHTYFDRIYRVNSVWNNAGKVSAHYSTPFPLTEALRKEVSGLDKVTFAHPQGSSVIEIGEEKRFLQENVLIVDAEFPDVFDIQEVRGDVKKILSQPYHALLTESTAKKFFGEDDPIGKTFRFKQKHDITVGGIIRDMPANTHLQTSMLLSFVPDEKFMGGILDHWTMISGTAVYVVLPDGADTAVLKTQLKVIADKNINARQEMPKGMHHDFEIQPLATVHFDSKYGGSGSVKPVNTSWLWFFSSIGVAVLVLACINFINLSTAQAITKAKEIGIRKSIGAGRLHLMGQFLREALSLCLVAGILSVAVVQIVLPEINTLLEKGIRFDILQAPELMGALLLGIMMASLLAGLYPAWVITKFNPAVTLKAGSTSTGDHRSSWLRKGLVVTQFTISAGLLIAVLFMSEQVKYMRNKNLGFDKENVVNVSIPNGQQHAAVFANGLQALHQVKDLSFATATPSNAGHWGTTMSLTDGNDPDRRYVTLIMGDDRFGPMYDLILLSGRFNTPTDTSYVADSLPKEERIIKAVVNETLVRTLGFESNESAIGKNFWCGMNSGNVEIVGVVADFNTASLHKEIEPVLMFSFPKFYSQAGIKIEPGSDFPETISAIRSAWERVYPDGIFEFKFLDQQIDAFYKSETRLYTLFLIFAGIAMLISCLGLWGLATFAAQTRTKEIGIRKVLGASINAIVMLLSKDFVLMVVIALTIASPLVYYFMNDWLNNFAFRAPIGWEIFALAGAASIALALITVSVQTLRAALANPVDSLRNE